MNPPHNELVGFACAYTPLTLIAAAGYAPYRVLPLSDSHDQAGQILHDNLCPHVKRILDRLLAGDIPAMRGMIFMNSCDAMRRLCDAWLSLKGAAPALLIDLPPAADERSVAFFASELERLAHTLEAWCEQKLESERIKQGIHNHNTLAERLNALAIRVREGTLPGGSRRLQTAYNTAATLPFEEAIAVIDGLLAEPPEANSDPSAPPIFLFGNILPDPEAFALFDACGARIVGEDLCTGSRLFAAIELSDDEDLFLGLARALLSRTPCARTLDLAHPGRMVEEVLARVAEVNARGAICHTVKFCDPYLARLPYIRETLQREGIPLLVLEGDCTLRSIGQQRTRIETFVEMLR